MIFDSKQTRDVLIVNGQSYDYYSLAAAEAAGLKDIAQLPYTLKVVLESLIRYHAKGMATSEDIEAVAGWLGTRGSAAEIAFRPARVLMPDSSGIPLLGDMAAMRDAIVRLGGDPRMVNPVVGIDFIVDHTVMVDEHGTDTAIAHNMELEFRQNHERFEFLRWGSQAFDHLRLIPPGVGICHQINLEYLARVVCTSDENGGVLAYPDSLVGMDSHTAMINSMGVVGWGVGGLEGGTVTMGEPISMLIPAVIGCRLSGELRPGVTSTDLVLTVTQFMRRHQLIGKFVEYFGSGVDELTLPDRATIANMTPEYGATMSFFAVDAETLRFLTSTGRDAQQVSLVESYAKAQGLWRDSTTVIPAYSDVIELDLNTIEPCVAGPSRPHERVALPDAPKAFSAAFPNNGGKVPVGSTDFGLANGDVVIAAITSCTNTSNPSVMVGAGILARNARRRGLKTKPWVKTSIAPGSRVVADYLERSGLQQPLNELGFYIAGFGCTTCMGNSGPLAEPISQAIEENGLATVAVLSGNRNFEARIHRNVRANFLASPPLVVAYALVGSICKDLTNEPLGDDSNGAPVYLRDIWPDRDEIRQVIDDTLSAEMYRSRYENVSDGTQQWKALTTASGTLFPWKPGSTFIRRPPFFDGIEATPPPIKNISGARVVAMFGDMLTTDHISPIGSISPETPAGQYLRSLGVEPKEFVTYAARRLNHDVMVRGTFANIRLRNEMTPDTEGSATIHMPSGERMSIFDAAERYRAEGVPLVVIAGVEYGAGSSRDWAAKGTSMLGIRAVIAESFERIHRSNLAGMGVLPLQFEPGITRNTLDLDGSEVFDVTGLEPKPTPGQKLACTITRTSGTTETITLLCRLDTKSEVDYYEHGGILHYVLRKRLKGGDA